MSIYWPAIGATLLPNLGGLAGGVITKKAIPSWYEHLKKPEWRPPNWAFGPVWTTLYCSMGYASYLVYRDGGGFDGPARLPLILYGTQLALNWIWSPIFFGLKSVKGGFWAILPLDAAVIACGFMFHKINQTAGLLFLPYAAWLGLASTLAYALYRDNPDSEKIKEL